MTEYNNRLAKETSPYLLQHAHNPVDWYPWGEEALERAREEDKPILVSIGYSACHWCHVMERESFENVETAGIMNRHFINIKIDREERPDLDHIYMDAVQAMTGSGGWPLNVFLTPALKPFYGGTYFPPERAYNRSSWPEVLQGIAQAFNERRDEIEEQAENMREHLVKANAFGQEKSSDQEGSTLISPETADAIFDNLMKNADQEWGGFGRAPKFPQTFIIQYLLRYHWVRGNEVALRQALLSIDKMIEGGIYDQLGGGFARYSTDKEWLAPHFEKMLYDNALLVNILSEAYSLTGKPRYREVIMETLGFVERELSDGHGGFFAALDADSEGEEGKYYVWSEEEIRELLGDDAGIFCAYYQVEPGGNWEGKNILHVHGSKVEFCRSKLIDLDDLENVLGRGRALLFTARGRRERPGLDDKVILGWNALMNTAYCKAYAATGERRLMEVAERNMQFLTDHLYAGEGGGFQHSWKDRKARHRAFLDDYAFLIEALLNLYQVSASLVWLEKARAITEYVLGHFSEEEGSLFYFTEDGQEDVIIRKKEVYDGATPSGNATMAWNLARLGTYFDKADWRRRAEAMLISLGRLIIGYPSSFGMWTCFLLETIHSRSEIVILGEDFQQKLWQVLSSYIPHKVVMASKDPDFYYPMLTGKGQPGTTLIYLCKDFYCRQPVDNIKALLDQIQA